MRPAAPSVFPRRVDGAGGFGGEGGDRANRREGREVGAERPCELVQGSDAGVGFAGLQHRDHPPAHAGPCAQLVERQVLVESARSDPPADRSEQFGRGTLGTRGREALLVPFSSVLPALAASRRHWRAIYCLGRILHWIPGIAEEGWHRRRRKEEARW